MQWASWVIRAASLTQDDVVTCHKPDALKKKPRALVLIILDHPNPIVVPLKVVWIPGGQRARLGTGESAIPGKQFLVYSVVKSTNHCEEIGLAFHDLPKSRRPFERRPVATARKFSPMASLSSSQPVPFPIV